MLPLYGVEWLEATVAKGGFSAKMVCNEQGAIFFPANLQHREQKVENVSYEDEYVGNAVAAMLAPHSIEIRYHRDFTDERIRRVVSGLLAEPRLAFMRGWRVTYQGRDVRVLASRNP